MCSVCVMDTSDPDIRFDETGQCNHCKPAIERLKREIFIDPVQKREALNALVDKIKAEGKGQKYDCLIGLSGGVDSSYLAWVVVKELGLRPLAVHLDNGWNSELAVKNIENIVTRLGIDLYTHVINWEEFKALQKAFLRASVIDVELLTDHAIGETLHRVSKSHHIRYFLSGYNFQSESVMPAAWLYPYKMDSLNIRDIYRKHGEGLPLKTFKFLSFYNYLTFGNNAMKLVPVLNYLDYNKREALKLLERELGWQNYGNKHDESVFTKFYQNVILPRKFNVDKRKAHHSSLICSGQMTREEAMADLAKPILTDEQYAADLDYFLKKLNLGETEFTAIMATAPRDHWHYRSYAKIKYRLGKLYRSVFK